MTRFKLFGAAAIVSMLIAASASAQPAVQEPGMEAFVHPNSDLGIGTAWPATPVNAQASAQTARPVMRHTLTGKSVKSGTK